MSATPTSSPNPFAALRQFTRKRPEVEHCDLCGKELAKQHEHLLEPAKRKLVCACDACAILFSGHQETRFRRVPRRIEWLPQFRITDEQWEGLHLPINMAFFYRSSVAERVVAMYPSPAGATESLLTFEAWRDLENDNPILTEFEPDVEALLVNRIDPFRSYIRTPIDECFKLVGLIRTHWRGLSGGADVWREIAQFFQSLKERSITRE